MAHAHNEKIIAEMQHINRETAQLIRESYKTLDAYNAWKWYEVVAILTIIGTTVALIKVFLI